MILASQCICNICENLDPQGNCVKRDVGQIFGIENATDDLVSSLQEFIFLWIFYSSVCQFDRKIFEQWNKITIEFRAIVEDAFSWPIIS